MKECTLYVPVWISDMNILQRWMPIKQPMYIV